MSQQRESIHEPASEQELAAYVDLIVQTFAADPEHIRSWFAKVGRDKLRVLKSADEVVAGLVYYPMGQFFGGRSVPCWGVAGVGVAVDRRAEGFGSALMAAGLDELHAAGVALSALYPATQPIYRRLGWELAGSRLSYELDPKDIRVRTEAVGDVDARTMRRMSASDMDTVRALYERRARATSGNLDRGDMIWSRVTDVRQEPVFSYVVDAGGVPEGYVIFEQAGTPQELTLIVRDLSYNTPAAGRAILQLFANHRSMANCVRFWGAPNEATAILLGEGVLEQTRRQDWMLRVVRAREALEARGYPSGLTAMLEFELADEQLASNSGRFVLTVAGGKGRIEPGGAGAYRLDACGLAALYTGFASPAELRLVGQLEGAGDDATLQAVFCGPAAWMPDFF